MAKDKIEAKNVNVYVGSKRSSRRKSKATPKAAPTQNKTQTKWRLRGKPGEIISVTGKSFMNNVKANANKELLKTIAWGLLGAAMEPLVPTLIQAVTKTDMSGYKGLATGVGAAAVLGLATGKPAITVGAVSAASAHLLYSEGTGAIENITGVEIFRMHPDTVVTSAQINEAISEGVAGQTQALSDGISTKCTSCGQSAA